MLQSVRRGFSFLGQAVEMARKDPDLLKPSFIAVAVGAVVSLVGAAPLVAVAVLGGDSGPARGLLYALGGLLIFAQYAVAYIFSGMTVYLVYGYLGEGDGRMDRAWAIVQRDVLDLLSLAVVSTLVKLLTNAARGRGRRGQRNPVGGMIANAIDTLWTSATHFILPAMVIEDLNLGQAVKRAGEIVRKNLLLVAVTEIGVSAVVGFIGFLLGLGAIALGVGVFVLLVNVSFIAAAVLAVLVAGTLMALVTALSSYVTTAYHTCLFLWARDVERAVTAGQSAQVVRAPAPVAAVLAAA